MDINKLKGHVPDAVISQIPSVMTTFKIDTALKLSHFLAQCGHESGGFKLVQENLNYGAKGLLGVFKKYFPTEAKALQYERKPEKIANLVYGSRMGNGNEASGDGYKFRGRGYIQLTGKDNLIGIRGLCSAGTPPISGLYINDLTGIGLRDLDSGVDEEDKTAYTLIERKIDQAANMLKAESLAYFQSRWNYTTSALMAIWAFMVSRLNRYPLLRFGGVLG